MTYSNQDYLDILEKIIFNLSYEYIQNKIYIDVWEDDEDYCKEEKEKNKKIKKELEILVDIYDIVKDHIENWKGWYYGKENN